MTDPRNKNQSRPSTSRTDGGRSGQPARSSESTPAPQRSNEPAEQQRLPKDTFGTPPLHLLRGKKDESRSDESQGDESREDKAARALDPRAPRSPDETQDPRTSPTRTPRQP